MKQVARGVEFLPNQFFAGKHAFYLRASVRMFYFRTLWLFFFNHLHVRLVVFTTNGEVLLILGNNLLHATNKSECREIALSRACTDALAFLEHKPVV